MRKDKFDGYTTPRATIIERLVKAFIIGLVILIAGSVIAGCLSSLRGCMPNYSEGSRSGVVVKLSHKGLLPQTKSWEGTLHLGGANAATGANTWDFSVRDPAVVDQLKAAQDGGRQVNLHYHQWAYKPFLIETDYEVDGVK